MSRQGAVGKEEDADIVEVSRVVVDEEEEVLHWLLHWSQFHRKVSCSMLRLWTSLYLSRETCRAQSRAPRYKDWAEPDLHCCKQVKLWENKSKQTKRSFYLRESQPVQGRLPTGMQG